MVAERWLSTSFGKQINLTDLGQLKKFLARHGLEADKSLGQHFLISESAVEAIVEAAASYATVLEIGPGPGVLTSPLSLRVERYVALEVDTSVASALKESSPMADVRFEDALQVDLADILRLLPQPRAIVSNLPYYITGPLLAKIADARAEISRAVLMMQREVGTRILSRPGGSARGALSVILQRQFSIERLIDVPAKAFYPPPKVDSVVLVLIPRISEESPEFERWLDRLVHFGFAQRRKTLVNNFTGGLRVDRVTAEGWIETAGLTEMARAQELREEQWVTLARLIPPR